MRKNKPAILIVDDDKNTREGLDRALHDSYDIFTAESAETALRIMDKQPIDVLLSDLRMPGMDGLTLVRRAMAGNPEIISILLTAYGNAETAIDAMKHGVSDFLTKPVNLDHLDILIKRLLHVKRMEGENVYLQRQLDEKYGMESIVGNAPAMQQLFDIIRQAAPTNATVLLQGESGTGKELVAHALHRLSARSKGPFVPVHCAALAPELLESELFGHEKGSFTGATGRRKGRFELADGGTLFLDEISEIDASVQVKLLRVLEERSFERVGGDETLEVDIRIIAATNRDLKSMVREGRFREDLFFRLDVINIVMPPLRERLSDIPILCDHFIREFSRANGKSVTGMTPDTANILSSYPWPGNVRELRNTMEKMVVLSRGDRLTARDIPINIKNEARGTPDSPSADSASGGLEQADSLAENEKRLIMSALRKCGDNRTRAARELGISRRTLHRKLREYERAETRAPRAGDAP